MQEKEEVIENTSGEGIGYVPVTRGHREGFGDCAKQDRANRFDLTLVWAPAEPPAKRAKTAEVRLSSASDVPMTPRSDDNAKGSSDEEVVVVMVRYYVLAECFQLYKTI